MAKPKQPRKEVVSFRLEPKIKYLMDIAARVQRRSPTNYIEYTLENSLRDVEIEKNKSVLQMAEYLWSTDESTRILNLAEKYPELLVYEEQLVIDFIKQMPAFYFNNQFAPESYRFYQMIKSALNGNEDDLHYINMLNDFYTSMIDTKSMSSLPVKYKIKRFIESMLSSNYTANLYEITVWNIVRSTGYDYAFLKEGDPQDINNYDLDRLSEQWLSILLIAPFPELWIGKWWIHEEYICPRTGLLPEK